MTCITSHLSQADLSTIAEYPLDGALNAIRETFRQAGFSTSSTQCQLDISAGSPEQSRLFTEAIQQLLDILSNSTAGMHLTSGPRDGSLSQDLFAIEVQVRRGIFKHWHYFYPLVGVLVTQATDEAIWDSAAALVKAISQPTPTASFPSSFSYTSANHSSASQRPFEQIQHKFKIQLSKQIRNCTYLDVGGFHEKYFENKSWSQHADRVWRSIKDCRSNGRWKDLPVPTSPDKLCDWWFGLQANFLGNARAEYCKSKPHEMGSQDTKHQLQVFIKTRQGGPSCLNNDRNDVLVIGLLEESSFDWEGTLLQLAQCVQEVFSHQPMRQFVHGFMLRNSRMETWVFDRSGPYSGGTFDIHDEPEKFIHIMCGYLMMDDEELGLDAVTERHGGQIFVTLPARGKTQKVELEHEPIAHQRALLCQGTYCYRAKIAENKDFNCVIKFSWTSEMRKSEATLLAKAWERGVVGLPELLGHREVTSIYNLRKDLVFAKPHEFRATAASTDSILSQRMTPNQSFDQLHSLSKACNVPRQKRCSVDARDSVSKTSRPDRQWTGAEHTDNQRISPVQESKGTSPTHQSNSAFDNRILQVLLISPVGKPISQYSSIRELLEGLRGAIKTHKSLYMDGKILHRDISENNIIIPFDLEKTDGPKGVLIDLDLAEEEGKASSGKRHQTGTLEFMAIEVLLGISHTYRHDLESFFYVLIWLCVQRGSHLSGKRKDQLENSMLRGWCVGSYEDIARNKRGDMDGGGLEQIMEEFPYFCEHVKPLCTTLRNALFPCANDRLFTGTPQDPDTLYSPIIEAFDDALTTIRH